MIASIKIKSGILGFRRDSRKWFSEMTRIVEISSDGTAKKIEMPIEKFDASQVVCVVDEQRKIIWLWKGKNAGMKLKFAGAKVARKLGKEYGKHFTIVPLEDGEEPSEFRSVLSL